MTLPQPVPADVVDDGRTMHERMLAGESYVGDDGVAAEYHAGQELSRAYNATSARETDLRASLLRQMLGSVGESCEVRPPFHVDFGVRIHLGHHVFANFGLTVLDVAEVRIGDHVQIGPHVQLLTPTHPVDPDERRAAWESAKPITIDDNVWLGGGVIVCPGVTIGADTVVGAGSVGTRDLPSGVVAVGNPARVVRSVRD